MNDDKDRRAAVPGDLTTAAKPVSRWQSTDAALIAAARMLAAARARNGAPATEIAAIFDRCDSFLQHARESVPLVALDCLFQLERELVATMNDDERSAALALYRAEGNAAAERWRREAVLGLVGRGDGVPRVAMLQGLMQLVHAVRLRDRLRIETLRRQVSALGVLLIAAVVFFTGWALLGGFEWVQQEEVEVTLAMALVNGVLFGFLGGLLSVVFSLPQRAATEQALELRGSWVTTIVRPFVGAAVAIPIAFFLQSGLLSLGNVTPAFDLALCFVAGFSERWFSAQFDRLTGRTEG